MVDCEWHLTAQPMTAVLPSQGGPAPLWNPPARERGTPLDPCNGPRIVLESKRTLAYLRGPDPVGLRGLVVSLCGRATGSIEGMALAMP